jgi:hypothetical protein
MFYSILQRPPYGIQVADVEGVKTVTVSVATDGSRLVAVVSQMASFLLTEDDPAYEFSFEIGVFSLDGDHENFSTMDRYVAAPFIPHEIRSEIMLVVCESAKALIKLEKPDLIFMVTKERNLPAKAMVKYDILIDTLYACGFEIRGDGTDAAGRHFWTMQRV